MPIEYRLHKLTIRNFRGLRSLDIELPEKAPSVLIGANNSCKSTILEAISLVLSGPTAYNFTPGKYDFFHDISGNSTDNFELSFSFVPLTGMQLPAVRGGYGEPVSVHGARVTGSVKNNHYSHDTRLIDDSSNPILLPVSLPLKGAPKEKWKEHGLSFRQRYVRWTDISDYRPDVWLLRPGNLFVSLFQWKTGPLQRLSKMLAKRFFETKWDFEFEKKNRPMPDALQNVHRFFSEAIKEFPFWRDDMKPKLRDTLSLYVGRQAQIDIKPDILTIEEWLAGQLALSFSADGGGATTPLDKMGDGWQSLVRIATLDVLSQYPSETDSRVVLLYEEPESFLHPHLSRKLRGVLDRLATAGWTIIITTHSPNLVSFSGKQSIIRLTRNGEDVAARILRADEVDGAPKFQERLDERGAHEMLFAQKVILCEGQDDVFAIRSFLEKRSKIDLDGRSISIIRAGDVGQLPSFASMSLKLGIPWCAISDEDKRADGTINPVTKDIRDRLSKLISRPDVQLFWPNDLESCIGKTTGKADPEWQSKNIEPQSTSDIQKTYPDYFSVCDSVREWIMK